MGLCLVNTFSLLVFAVGDAEASGLPSADNVEAPYESGADKAEKTAADTNDETAEE